MVTGMFESFFGNDEIKEELSSMLLSGSLPHAIAFSGEEGTGCDFFARLVAEQYLNDHNGLVMRNVHPDFVTVQGSGSSGQVSVQDVREALYEMNKAAVMTEGFRVLHIKRAENLNSYSSNALLKMMEEPPEGVIFILTVRRFDDLLATIRSRVVEYRIKPLNIDECAKQAQVQCEELSKEQALRYSRLFGGRLGLVLKAAKENDYSFCVSSAEKVIDASYKKSRYAILSSIAQINDREQLFLTMNIVLSGVKQRIRENPDDSRIAIKIYDSVCDFMEQLESFVNVKTAAVVLAEKICK